MSIKKVEIFCTDCGVEQSLDKFGGKRKGIRLGSARTDKICGGCGKLSKYWGKWKIDAGLSLVIRREFFICLKILSLELNGDGNIEIHCPICGRALTLLSPKFWPKTADCESCAGEVSYFRQLETRKKFYSNPTGKRQRYLYIEVPMRHIIIWRHRVHCERT